jgi:hypothetical protein
MRAFLPLERRVIKRAWMMSLQIFDGHKPCFRLCSQFQGSDLGFSAFRHFFLYDQFSQVEAMSTQRVLR